MLLSRDAILRHMKEGNIIIDPYEPKKLKTTSYDVTLGEYFWRESHPNGGHTIHNIYDDASTKRIWSGPHEAKTTEKFSEEMNMKFSNIKPGDKIIMIHPGETILAHTQEYVGGRTKCVGKMYARSSLGRNFIEVCKDAGWGDVGYFNRWTMEVTNNSQHFTIPLVVGRRIAQMVFYEVEPILDKDYSQDKGKYQVADDLEKLKKDWNPHMMLPKMHLDWEVKEF
ncbi:MAG: hypothetical protein A2931_03750 [Candidatus Niyogibacteria bacterium RIFCSPLOWO2_01_FULL_45_48]|uniref:Uncharacterized protein n=2 Tax=Candidatus Niyogiibacteriota TaxID=1817912 RepID=A0A1G2EWV1_9BACT|nr:MAG: hypothetical protein A3J00_00825 [Candidatus Niyogibacteria bacterium RIFCSPLOWO2_02_FULL_45_13]OGZ30943.1 MAG: hypothetical protein A2931_03750 [Candidatus Niyogibacteria bacterium RIFCSPLOWO2_01_FULL_45_48]